jgi:hypothetical protein
MCGEFIKTVILPILPLFLIGFFSYENLEEFFAFCFGVFIGFVVYEIFLKD